jgi:threonine/homoserine/homoserine lactone efflux protein
MALLDLMVSVIVVTTSGALAPGPVVFATILEGSRHGAKAGLVFTLAHALVEFPLVLLLAIGFVSINQQAIRFFVGILGGLALLFFGFQQARVAIKAEATEQRPNKLKQSGLFVTGLALNALNPFFIIWWLTVGAKLILDTLSYGSFAAIPFMYFPHIMIDLAWLVILAYMAMKGRNLIGSKGYRLLLGIFGIVLVMFGLNFIASALLG